MKTDIDPSLSAEELADIILENPEAAESCDLSVLDKLSGEDWVRLLTKHPRLADKCRWSSLSGEDWAVLLCSQPQFAANCDAWDQMDGGDWGLLLREQPQFEEKCDWGKLRDYSWAALLSERPEFSDRCGCWDRMHPHSIGCLLARQPQFAGKFDLARLDGRDWARMLRSQPQFADQCDWAKLTADNWATLLAAQPSFSTRCPWNSFPLPTVAAILREQPAAAEAARVARHMAGHILAIALDGRSRAVEFGRREMKPGEESAGADGIKFVPYASLEPEDTTLLIELDGDRILRRPLALTHLDGITFQNRGDMFGEIRKGRWLYATRSKQWVWWSSWIVEVPEDFQFEASKLVIPFVRAMVSGDGDEGYFARPKDIRYGDLVPDGESLQLQITKPYDSKISSWTEGIDRLEMEAALTDLEPY